jgi:hypothetical protein
MNFAAWLFRKLNGFQVAQLVLPDSNALPVFCGA